MGTSPHPANITPTEPIASRTYDVRTVAYDERHGARVANSNYRLAPEVHFPRPLEDAWCALAFFRQEGVALGLDASRVAVLGFSAGANLAELMGVTAPGDFQAADCPAGVTGAPAAVVAGAGPADLLRLPALGDATVEAYVGATKSEAPERYTQASPVS